jgi:hypothetical protein
VLLAIFDLRRGLRVAAGNSLWRERRGRSGGVQRQGARDGGGGSRQHGHSSVRRERRCMAGGGSPRAKARMKTAGRESSRRR